MKFWSMLAATASIFAVGTALAAEPEPATPQKGKAERGELRVGAGYYDAGLLGGQAEEAVALNAEWLFPSPQFLDWAGQPRPHVGVHKNLGGDRDFLYAGLSWEWDIGASFFAGFSLGAAVHDGDLDGRDGGSKLGTRALFRESLTIGWRINPKYNLSIMADHVSNANLGGNNGGLDTVMLRVGYKF